MKRSRRTWRRRAPHLVAVITTALLCHSANGASGSWSTTGPYGGSVAALAVYEASPNTLWAAGRGGVFRTTNSGSTWTRIEVGLPGSSLPADLVAATGSPVVYLGTGSNQVFRSGNGGDLWVPTALSVPSTDVIADIAIQRATTNSIAVATFNGAYVSTNGGSSWVGPGSFSGSPQFTSIEYAADGTLYLGVSYYASGSGSDPVLFKSTTGGSSWTPVSALTESTFFSVTRVVTAPTSASRVFVSNGGSVQTSPDGGATWNNVTPPPCSGGITTIQPHPTAATGLIIGCRNTGVAITSDATVASPTWTTFGAATGLTANGTNAVQASTIAAHPAFPVTATLWVGTQDGGLFASSNGGTTWTAINNGYQSANIRALATHPLDTGSSTVILAGYGDAFTTTHAIYRSTDNGTTWAASDTNLNAEQIRSIAIDPTTVDNNALTAENFTVYAAGRSERIPTIPSKDGGIYKSTDAGQTWTTIDNGIAQFTQGAFTYRDMGTIRTVALDPRSCLVPPPSGPCAIGTGPLQTLYVAGGGRPNLSAAGQPYLSARLYKSTNAGANWSPSENGLPLPQDLGPAPSVNLAYTGVVPLVIDPGNPQTLYIGTFMSYDSTIAGTAEPTLANGVFKSTDGGATWTHMSNGLPRIGGPASSHWDTLALAINPANTQVLYAGVIDFYAPVWAGHVYKTTDGGANWAEADIGIAGQDVRALYVDPSDATGNTVYAATGGTAANPGGVYRTTDGGATWNSFSIGLPADAATALALPKQPTGQPTRVLTGTNAGVWDYTFAPDPDADGAPSSMEQSVQSGDGNGDGLPDANQTSVASLDAPASSSGPIGMASPNAPSNVTMTTSIVGGTCTQLNNVSDLQASLYPPDPIGSATSHDPWGLVSFSLPGCSSATVRVKFHGANFGSGWFWRNYGPRLPGNSASFGWYTFSGARLIDAQTWELKIDASRQGNYRSDADNILFIGGPATLPDLVFDNGYE